MTSRYDEPNRTARAANQVFRWLAEAGISVDAMLQREAGEGEKQTDLIILTHSVREGTMNEVIARMQGLPTVLAPITRIRKEELA